MKNARNPDAECTNSHNSMDIHLEKMQNPRSSNAYLFNDFYRCDVNASLIIDSIKKIHHKRSNTYELYQMEMLDQRRIKISFDLDSWTTGKEIHNPISKPVNYAKLEVI